MNSNTARLASRREEAVNEQLLHQGGEETLDNRIDAPMFVKPA